MNTKISYRGLIYKIASGSSHYHVYDSVSKAWSKHKAPPGASSIKDINQHLNKSTDDSSGRIHSIHDHGGNKVGVGSFGQGKGYMIVHGPDHKSLQELKKHVNTFSQNGGNDESHRDLSKLVKNVNSGKPPVKRKEHKRCEVGTHWNDKQNKCLKLPPDVESASNKANSASDKHQELHGSNTGAQAASKSYQKKQFQAHTNLGKMHRGVEKSLQHHGFGEKAKEHGQTASDHEYSAKSWK